MLSNGGLERNLQEDDLSCKKLARRRILQDLFLVQDYGRKKKHSHAESCENCIGSEKLARAFQDMDSTSSGSSLNTN